MRRLLLALLFLAASTAAYATNLSTAASGLAPGQFVELTGMTGYTIHGNTGDVFRSDNAGCNPGDLNTEYSGKAVWNPILRQFMHIGYCHGTCGNKENGPQDGNFVVYDDATDTWSKPTGPATGGVHSYDDQALDPTTGAMYKVKYNDTAFWRKPSGGAWTQLSDIPKSNTQCCTALAEFPDRNSIVQWDGDWGLREFNIGTSTWTQRARGNGDDGSGLPQFTGRAYPVFAIYSARAHAVIFGGDALLMKYNADGSFTTLTHSGGLSSMTIGGPYANGSSINVDPVTGKLIILQSMVMYEFDPGTTNGATGSWTTKSGVTIPSFFNTAADGMSESLISAPISTYGVIMYVKCDDVSTCRTFLYRNAASVAQCADSTDNDGDGLTDTSDPDCFSSSDTTEDPCRDGSAYCDTKCAQSGVMRCYTFDATSGPEVLLHTWRPSGKTCTCTSSCPGGGSCISGVCVNGPTCDADSQCPGATCSSVCSLTGSGAANKACWDILTTDGADGTSSSLRVQIPTLSGSDSSGAWVFNASDANGASGRFTPGETFWVRWDQKVDSYFATHDYTGANGWKQLIAAQADQQGEFWTACDEGSFSSSRCATSDTHMEIVATQSPYSGSTSSGVPHVYGDTGAQSTQYQDNTTADGTPVCPSTGVRLQTLNAVCCHQAPADRAGCVDYVPGTWMRFWFQVNVGTLDVDNASRVRFYIAQQGGSRVLVNDTAISYPYGDSYNGMLKSDASCTGQTGGCAYGKFWLTPYQTNKDSSEAATTSYTYYDNLVISTEDPDPPGGTSSIPTISGARVAGGRVQ